MALSPEELEQIREIVRIELKQNPPVGGTMVRWFGVVGSGCLIVFLVVLALHVLVIGGFTAYYLMKGGAPN